MKDFRALWASISNAHGVLAFRTLAHAQKQLPDRQHVWSHQNARRLLLHFRNACQQGRSASAQLRQRPFRCDAAILCEPRGGPRWPTRQAQPLRHWHLGKPPHGFRYLDKPDAPLYPPLSCPSFDWREMRTRGENRGRNALDHTPLKLRQRRLTQCRRLHTAPDTGHHRNRQTNDGERNETLKRPELHKV